MEVLCRYLQGEHFWLLPNAKENASGGHLLSPAHPSLPTETRVPLQVLLGESPSKP